MRRPTVFWYVVLCTLQQVPPERGKVYQITLHHVQEHSVLHNHCREHLESRRLRLNLGNVCYQSLNLLYVPPSLTLRNFAFFPNNDLFTLILFLKCGVQL
jgi:hypothetical protein